MKIEIFNITKYQNGLNKLSARKAPNYVVEAYKDGYVNIVNTYYKERLKMIRNNTKLIIESKDILTLATLSENKYISEALKNSDLLFIKLFYQLTNMDIMTGNKLPPDMGRLIKPGASKANLKDLFKQLK